MQFILIMILSVMIHPDYDGQTFLVYLLQISFENYDHFHLVFRMDLFYTFVHKFLTISSLKSYFEKSIRFICKVLLSNIIFKSIVTVFLFII